ncbi:hypothetical protein [Photobacterium kishitanii]|uniref:hypothetical protein n=2 Tax=Photobacterium kishitanii TaxID=318456 RepID=UPI0011B1F559|nr:hypothetical protein [Photobacterium kishitanii]
MLLLSRLHSPNARFILPFLITVLMIISYPLFTPFIATYSQLWINLPFALFGIVIILNYKLPQAQSGVIAIIMLVAYSIILYWLQTSLANTDTKLIFCLLATLLPINLLLLRFLQLPKLLSFSMVALLLLVIIQCGIGAIISYFYQADFSNWQRIHLFTYHNISSLPLILIVFNLAISCCAGALAIRYHRRIDRHIFVCSLLATTTFIFFHYPFISSSAFIVCALFLLVDLGYCRYQQCFYDPSTQLADHRALSQMLARLHPHYAIAIIAIDHPNKIIEKHHPQAVADIQRSIATLLTQHTQCLQHLYFVSQQFIVIFEHKNGVECQSLLEQLQHDLAAEKHVIEPITTDSQPDEQTVKPKKGRKKTMKVSVSIGISDSANDQTAAAVLQQAIDVLETAQRTNKKKNQIYIADRNEALL